MLSKIRHLTKHSAPTSTDCSQQHFKIIQNKLLNISKKQIELANTTNKILDEVKPLEQCSNYEEFEDLLHPLNAKELEALNKDLEAMASVRESDLLEKFAPGPRDVEWENSQEGLNAVRELDASLGGRRKQTHKQTRKQTRKQIYKKKSHKRILKQSHKKYTSKRKHIYKRIHRRKH
jgi:hypothetical protein